MVQDIRAKFENAGNERAVIASILNYSDLVVEAASKLSEDAFITTHHRILYSIILSLYHNGVEKFDFVSIVNKANDLNVLEEIGGAEYVGALLNTPVSKSNFEYYLNRVVDSSTKYQLYMAAS